MAILIIVESPGKIAKISSFLGKNYVVKASRGHIRNLNEKQMSIDFDNHFEPIYVITQPDVVKNLKGAIKGIDMVYLASDSDFEGEAISQSLYDVLKPKNYKRIVFNSVTKEAILAAIKNAGQINKDLVGAQKARRVIDRLFGYMISPILQKQIGNFKLSAGRVQSSALRIVVDRENEIKNFLEKNQDSSFFKVHGIFSSLKANLYLSSDKKPYNMKDAYRGKTAQIEILDGSKPNINVTNFLDICLKSVFTVHSVNDKISYRSPSPPFETATLQQEANRKFGMKIDDTMKTAQKLYEGGYITYMRTDSVEISAEGHREIKKVIEKEYGKEYYQQNIYKNKSASAQEAHEAIRPTHPDLLSVEDEVGDKYQIKLYKLIWQRTIASQMKPAKINVTTIQIDISKYIDGKIEPLYYFQSQIEKIIFPGFMKVYVESTDDPEENGLVTNFSGKIPKIGDKLAMEEIVAKQEYLKPPSRYTQASLVKKLKDMGIGRPATYVTTIKTIMDRGYINISDIAGIKKDTMVYSIKSENKKHVMKIFEEKSNILLGKENKKIVPTELGKTVNEYLLKHFPEMLDYNFTAKMETELDNIADGKKIWYKVVQNFYDKLLPIIEKLSGQIKTTKENDRLLGKDKDGNEVYACHAKYGPVVKKMNGSKIIYAKIEGPMTLENITLKDALGLFKFPKLLGQYRDKDIYLHKGKYGLYIVYDKENCSLPEGTKDDIGLKDAIMAIKAKKSNQIAEFNIKEKNGKTVKAIILKGKSGWPYIHAIRGKTKTNYPLQKNIDPKTLTEKQVLELISKKNTFNKKGSYTKGGLKTNNKKGGSKTNKKDGSKTNNKKGSKTNNKKSTTT